MAYLGAAGDTSEVNPDDMNQKRSGKPIADGWYRVALDKDEIKHADWGVGLSMQFEILDGEYEGRKLFEFLCLEHSRSEEAQKIARTKLREFATAAGHKTPDQVEDTDALMGRPVMVEVYRAKDKSDYAEADGRKPRIGQFLSVARWKSEYGSDPAPAPKPVPSSGKSKPASRPAPAPYDDSEVPF